MIRSMLRRILVLCFAWICGSVCGFAPTPSRSHADERGVAEAEIPLGLNLGLRVPISGMQTLKGESVGRNTCLAGKYSRYSVASVYARSIDEPGLPELLSHLESLIGENPGQAAYLLLLDKNPRNLAAAAVMEQKLPRTLKRMEIAVSNGQSERFAIPRESAVVVIFSDRRLVKHRIDFRSVELNDSVRNQLSEEWSKVTAK